MQTTRKIMPLFIVILYLMSSLVSQAQEVDFQYQFNGKIKWMKLTNTGTLLASTGEALVGIKPNSNEVTFKLDRLKKVKLENLEFVPDTPYVIVKPRGLFKHTVVIDIVKGKIIFDSKEEKWQNGVTSRYFIGPEMMFVVNGAHKEKGLGQYRQGVGLYDLKTGKLVQIFERKANNPMTGLPDIMGDDIIIPGVKSIIRYSISSGNEKWKAKVGNANTVITNEETQEIYAFKQKKTNSVVYKINANNGNSMWAKENKIKGVVSIIKFTDHGLAIVTNIVSSGKKGLVGGVANKIKGSGKSKVYLLDMNSGADLWEKSPKTKGIISHFYVEKDGILFGVATGGINKVSFNGNALWKKPHKTGAGIQILATVPAGLLCISSSDTDIIDMNTGDSVFGKKIKYKNSKTVVSTFDQARDRFLISCKDGVYAVDGNSGSYKLINDNIKFERKETANSIRVRSEGILLSSSQNLMMLDFDGKEKWKVYHRPPGKSVFSTIVLGALTLTSGALMVASSARAGYLKGSGVPSYNATVKSDEHNAEGLSKVADASFKEMTKRFKATKSTENAAFILTRINKEVGLVKVDKDTGKTIYEIILDDKKPEYEVDDYAGILYYKSKSNTISAYKLNK